MRRGHRAPPVGSACGAWCSAGLWHHRVPHLLLVDPEGAEQESGSSLEDWANPEEQWRLPVLHSVAWKQPSAHTLLKTFVGVLQVPGRSASLQGKSSHSAKPNFRLFVKLSLATPL